MEEYIKNSGLIQIKLDVDKMNNGYEYPKLSIFIANLKQILEKYGDGYICTDDEYTNEVNHISIIKDPSKELNDGRMYRIEYDC